MHQVQVQLSDRLYQEAARRANIAGFENADEYVADVIQHDLHEAPENFDHLFTAEVAARLDKAVAQADAGKLMAWDELELRLSAKRETWLKTHAS